MQSGNGDRLDNFIQFVTEYSIRTEEMLRRHEQRMTQHEERIQRLEEIQADIRQILARLTS